MAVYSVAHLGGEFEQGPLSDIFDKLWRELECSDGEHQTVSVKHETEWCLSLYPSGRLVWENVEEDVAPRHMMGVSRETVMALWTALSEGNLSLIDQQPWGSGYGRDVIVIRDGQDAQ
ncbi:hypothetical protein D7W82_17210 [Corallococcus sp. CA049B]|uniref:hypothetical protein n=1 Tax=Corallococcus sp. CA049B TaxID=2316730 RepID=UPI000EA1220D|nr:hypothetical protein [Corallococcus sp. CA049B]RKG86225.1 hypothetical protein D7W82_17210 [Corallococcus sp. CA049B]